jgi:hypothetical protein
MVFLLSGNMWLYGDMIVGMMEKTGKIEELEKRVAELERLLDDAKALSAAGSGRRPYEPDRAVGPDFEIRGRGVSVGELFVGVDYVIRRGGLHVVCADSEDAHISFAMAFSGRMREYGGRISMDGDISGLYALRMCSAIVDAPKVTEPDPAMHLWWSIREELLFAGQSFSRDAIDDFAERISALSGAGRDVRKYLRRPVSALPRALRWNIYTDLAAKRHGVEILFIVAPDRLGSGFEWMDAARRYNGMGYTVVVQCSELSAQSLGLEYSVIGGEF